MIKTNLALKVNIYLCDTRTHTFPGLSGLDDDDVHSLLGNRYR